MCIWTSPVERVRYHSLEKREALHERLVITWLVERSGVELGGVLCDAGIVLVECSEDCGSENHGAMLIVLPVYHDYWCRSERPAI